MVRDVLRKRVMRTQVTLAAAAAAVLFGTGAAQAATLSTTDSFTGSALVYDPATDYSPGSGYAPPTSLGGYDGLLTLKGFNPALGTLNSVSISETIESSLEFKQAYAFGDSITINANLFVSGQDPYGGAGFGLPYTFSIAGTVAGHTYDTGTQYFNQTSGAYVNNLALAFGPFFASKIYVPVLGYVYLGPSTGSYLGNTTSTYTYAMTFDYDYTPSATGGAPEPTTWALLLLGLGSSGAALRARRRRGFAS